MFPSRTSATDNKIIVTAISTRNRSNTAVLSLTTKISSCSLSMVYFTTQRKKEAEFKRSPNISFANKMNKLKALVAVGATGLVGTLLYMHTATSSAPHPLRRVCDALCIYKPLAPDTHSNLIASVKKFQTCITTPSPSLQVLREAESLARDIRMHLAYIEVSVCTQSRNNKAAVSEYSEISNELLEMLESGLHNLHLDYAPP